jgi:hypothetical protein
MKASASRLGGLTRELWAHWQQTKDYWNDSKAREFESKYMEELVATVDRTVTTIEQLDKLITKVKRDCE